MGFIEASRAEGHAVESTCRVLREQGCQVPARTCRAWRRGVVSARTMTDARVVDAVRDVAWTLDAQGRGRLAPEGLHGLRKLTAYLRRTAIPDVSAGAVDRAMRTLGLVEVRRDVRPPSCTPARTRPSPTSSTPPVGWVDWYNNPRLHSSLGNLPPVEYEQDHHAALDREPRPVSDRQTTWGA